MPWVSIIIAAAASLHGYKNAREQGVPPYENARNHGFAPILKEPYEEDLRQRRELDKAKVLRDARRGQWIIISFVAWLVWAAWHYYRMRHM